MPREALAARPIARTGEALEAAPGLIVTQHSGEGKANQYFLRGYNLDHGTDLAIRVDGMPVNMRTHAHGQGYADLNFLIPELLGAMRVRKGPYFADDGDFATAGALRLDLVDRAGALRAGHGRQLRLLARPGGRLEGASATARCWRPARSPPIRVPGATATTCAD